jgi:hypothetical protein
MRVIKKTIIVMIQAIKNKVLVYGADSLFMACLPVVCCLLLACHLPFAFSTSFPVTNHSPAVEKYGKTAKRNQLW